MCDSSLEFRHQLAADRRVALRRCGEHGPPARCVVPSAQGSCGSGCGCAEAAGSRRSSANPEPPTAVAELRPLSRQTRASRAWKSGAPSPMRVFSLGDCSAIRRRSRTASDVGLERPGRNSRRVRDGPANGSRLDRHSGDRPPTPGTASRSTRRRVDPHGFGPRTGDVKATLTPRQREIVVLVAEGKTTRTRSPGSCGSRREPCGDTSRTSSRSLEETARGPAPSPGFNTRGEHTRLKETATMTGSETTVRPSCRLGVARFEPRHAPPLALQP